MCHTGATSIVGLQVMSKGVIAGIVMEDINAATTGSGLRAGGSSCIIAGEA